MTSKHASQPHDLPELDAAVPGDVPLAYLRSACYGSFVYDKMVRTVTDDPEDGDLVGVVDKYGKFFGWAFYNSRSIIALRMFSREPTPPTDQDIRQRILSAVALRQDVLQLNRQSDAYRLIHAEGDGLSGLIADKLGDYVVIELFSIAMFRRLHLIEDALVDAKLKIRKFIVRADKAVCRQEGFQLGRMENIKERERNHTIVENGVKFIIDLDRGHKTGFFCDQRENRLALTQFTPGKTVLDLCCYSGGFSCYAAKLGQAQEVTAVDLDENALAVAQQNASLNGVKIGFHHVDAFDFLRTASENKQQWEVVVVDPSKFVSNRQMLDLGLHKYSDLNKLAIGVVKPGGIMLTCSCSGLVDTATFVDTVGRAARAAKRNLQIFRVTGASPDHPAMAESQESFYLKAVWAYVK